MKDREDSAAELSAERSRRLVTLRKRKQQSECTVEAKRARREEEKVQKKKASCGESSQTRYKLYLPSCLLSHVIRIKTHPMFGSLRQTVRNEREQGRDLRQIESTQECTSTY